METRLVDVDRGYDFSGISSYEPIVEPIAAAAIGEPDVIGYQYAAVYADGTLHLSRMEGDVHEQRYATLVHYNPYSKMGHGLYAHDADALQGSMAQAVDILTSAGVSPDTITPGEPDNIQTVAYGDSYAGLSRDSAHRLTEVALRALQFSKWSAYELDSHSPDIAKLYYQDYEITIDVLVQRFGAAVLASEATRLIDKHYQTLHTNLHTPGLGHKPHSDGAPQDGAYMARATQVIRDAYELPTTMLNKGMWVNFMSLFGDADFWKVTREHYPYIFEQATSHILELPDQLEQKGSPYAMAVLNPVGVIQTHFPKAHQEIRAGRTDFVADIPDDQAVIITQFK